MYLPVWWCCYLSETRVYITSTRPLIACLDVHEGSRPCCLSNYYTIRGFFFFPFIHYACKNYGRARTGIQESSFPSVFLWLIRACSFSCKKRLMVHIYHNLALLGHCFSCLLFICEGSPCCTLAFSKPRCQEEIISCLFASLFKVP